METIKPFNLPKLSELRELGEEQLNKIMFELERHRSSQLLSASYDYTDLIDKIEKEYTSDFQVLADVLAEKRNRTTISA